MQQIDIHSDHDAIMVDLVLDCLTPIKLNEADKFFFTHNEARIFLAKVKEMVIKF